MVVSMYQASQWLANNHYKLYSPTVLSSIELDTLAFQLPSGLGAAYTSAESKKHQVKNQPVQQHREAIIAGEFQATSQHNYSKHLEQQTSTQVN